MRNNKQCNMMESPPLLPLSALFFFYRDDLVASSQFEDEELEDYQVVWFYNLSFPAKKYWADRGYAEALPLPWLICGNRRVFMNVLSNSPDHDLSYTIWRRMHWKALFAAGWSDPCNLSDKPTDKFLPQRHPRNRIRTYGLG